MSGATHKDVTNLAAFTVKTSLPIFAAYFPLGIVYGLVFCHLHFPWLLAVVASLLIYGGSVQFVAASMMAKHLSIVNIVTTCLFLGLRNSFYGLSFLKRFKNVSWLKRTWLAFNQVDGTYAILVSHQLEDKKQDMRYCLWLSTIIYLYWIAGTVIGVALSTTASNIKGLGFVLPCFFMTVAVEQYHKLKSLQPFIIAALSGVIAMLWLPHYFLLLSISLSAVLLLVSQR